MEGRVLAAIITSSVSLIVALFAWFKTYQLNDQKFEIDKKLNALQAEFNSDLEKTKSELIKQREEELAKNKESSDLNNAKIRAMIDCNKAMQKLKHTITLISNAIPESLSYKELNDIVTKDVNNMEKVYIESMENLEDRIRRTVHDSKNVAVDFKKQINSISQAEYEGGLSQSTVHRFSTHRKYFSEIQDIIRDRMYELIYEI